MTGVTLSVAVLGFLSPANRGALLTSILVLYALMGIQAGYISARLYKMMKAPPNLLLCFFFVLF
jgi:transmembrane 9 superfamily protein 2/4